VRQVLWLPVILLELADWELLLLYLLVRGLQLSRRIYWKVELFRLGRVLFGAHLFISCSFVFFFRGDIEEVFIRNQCITVHPASGDGLVDDLLFGCRSIGFLEAESKRPLQLNVFLVVAPWCEDIFAEFDLFVRLRAGGERSLLSRLLWLV